MTMFPKEDHYATKQAEVDAIFGNGLALFLESGCGLGLCADKLDLLLHILFVRVTIVGVGITKVLRTNEPCIRFALLNQLIVRPLLNDRAIGHDGDIVGVPDCRQSVRNHNGGAIFRDAVERLLHHLLRLGIESASCLV
jgi:hypothetical protein